VNRNSLQDYINIIVFSNIPCSYKFMAGLYKNLLQYYVYIQCKLLLEMYSYSRVGNQQGQDIMYIPCSCKFIARSYKNSLQYYVNIHCRLQFEIRCVMHAPPYIMYPAGTRYYICICTAGTRYYICIFTAGTRYIIYVYLLQI
jgi:hypothetical protein